MDVYIDMGNTSGGALGAAHPDNITYTHHTTDVVTTANLIQDILYIIVTPIICVFGFVGNIFSLVVLIKVRARTLSKGEGKESTALLGMVLLAVSDMCFCLVVFPRALVTITATTSLFEQRGFPLYYQVYGTGLVTTFILTSTWITVVLSLFRYIGICHPLRARHLIGQLGTRMTYFVTIAFCIAFNLPSFWQYRVCPYEYNGRQFYLIDIGVFDLSKKPGIAFLWIRNTFGLLLPTLLLSFCNWSLIKALRESQRMHKRCRVSERRSQSSFKITLTLVVIVVMFILLVFPCEVMDFLHDVLDVEGTRIETFLVMRAFANIFQVVNFASNFILYCAIGGQFRDVLCATFCRCCWSGGNIRQHGRMGHRGYSSGKTYTTSMSSYTGTQTTVANFSIRPSTVSEV